MAFAVRLNKKGKKKSMRGKSTLARKVRRSGARLLRKRRAEQVGQWDTTWVRRAKKSARKAHMTRGTRRKNVGRVASGAFDVYLRGKHIDTVFYSPSTTVSPASVKRSLISHDGYDSDIVVRKRWVKKAGPAKPRGFRRTETIYVVQGNYGQGWEDLTAETKWSEAKLRKREYVENEGGSYRIISRRVKK